MSEIITLSYEWWIKLTPLWKKFVYETRLCGYDKEDLKQECYLLLVKCLEKYDAALGVPFESYYKVQLYGWRANQNRKKYDLLTITQEEEGNPFLKIPDKQNVEQEVQRKLRVEQIMDYLANLSPKDKAIIYAFYIEQKPLYEVAKDLGMKYKSVEARKARLIRKIRYHFSYH